MIPIVIFTALSLILCRVTDGLALSSATCAIDNQILKLAALAKEDAAVLSYCSSYLMIPPVTKTVVSTARTITPYVYVHVHLHC